MTQTPKPFNYSVLWSQIEREALARYANALTRRDFIRLMSMSAAALAFARVGAASAAPRKPQPARALTRQDASPIVSTETLINGVAAGDTTQTSTVLWTRTTAPGAVTFEVSADDFATIAAQATADADDALVPVKAMISDLTAGTAYTYRVTDATGGTLTGRFTTPAADGEKRGLVFGVSGDWRGELRPYPAIANVLDYDLAFFVEHGDTIYADYPTLDVPAEQATTLEDYRKKHGEVYSERFGFNSWAGVRAATNIYATIDDHEVTNDFAGGAAPETDPRFAEEDVPFINQTALYRNGLQAFAEYNPMDVQTYEGTGDPRMDGVIKLYRYVTYGADAAVIVLDARSFRDASLSAPTDISDLAAINQFLIDTFTPDRTFLGRQQVDDLKRDLLDAHERGVTWKFVMIPEPIQQQGWLGGNDRWEGYAPERTEVVQFIADSGITNVVWVSADVHTTYVNELFYQTEAGGDLIPTDQWEISTGSVGFYPPTGMALVAGAHDFGLVTDSAYNEYLTKTPAEQDEYLLGIFNRLVLRLQGFDTLGLSEEKATLEQGLYIVGHTFGWTLFEIDADTQALTVTTFGVPAYSAQDLADDADAVVARQPAIMHRFTVQAV